MTNKSSEGKKWLICLMSAILFLLIASPFMYKCTGFLFSKLTLKTEQNGCPNFLGLIIHAIIFSLLIRVMMLIIPVTESFTGYSGIAKPGDMLTCNAAELMAEVNNCESCVDSAQLCMRNPGTSKCTEAVNACQKTCKNSDTKEAMNSCKYICGHNDYLNSARCTQRLAKSQPVSYHKINNPGKVNITGVGDVELCQVTNRQPSGWTDFCSGSDCMNEWNKIQKFNPVALNN